ncbi:MAG: hypothetical protein QFB89_07865, partial [Pseudomonadota bacterium]|nr:hypothetical protein [Pseudomonadota bacterium]
MLIHETPYENMGPYGKTHSSFVPIPIQSRKIAQSNAFYLFLCRKSLPKGGILHQQSVGFLECGVVERADQFIGQSLPFLDAVERTSRAATLNRPVLVIGERGTGKELI